MLKRAYRTVENRLFVTETRLDVTSTTNRRVTWSLRTTHIRKTAGQSGDTLNYTKERQRRCNTLSERPRTVQGASNAAAEHLAIANGRQRRPERPPDPYIFRKFATRRCDFRHQPCIGSNHSANARRSKAQKQRAKRHAQNGPKGPALCDGNTAALVTTATISMILPLQVPARERATAGFDPRPSRGAP